MHFTVPDICNQDGCLISLTLQRFKYRTNTNGATLYTETSETLKMIETHFYTPPHFSVDLSVSVRPSVRAQHFRSIT